MANTKISALTANTNPNGNEELVYAYNNANGKMTLDTMKTFANTGQQAELVSGTNIKTINNQSILGAGNIDIQGGGGGGGEGYDAIVDAGGNGDYTTIGAAVDANKRKIFVMNGTYNETQGHFITMSSVDKIIIHGQSSVGVVVNVSLTSVQTQRSDYNNYPGFLFLDASATDSSEVEIKNITFNASVNTDQFQAYIIRGNGKSAGLASIIIDNCIFNVSNDGSDRAWFNIAGYKTEPKGIVDISNCILHTTSNTADMRLDCSETIVDNDGCTYKNCYFLVSAKSSNPGRADVRSAHDCIIKFDVTNMGSITFAGSKLERCDINVGANVSSSVPMDITLSDVHNCTFEGRHTSNTPLKIGTSAEVPAWQSSTSYSVGDQVINDYEFFQCKTAHTSSSSFLSDEDNREPIATMEIQDASECSFKTSETISLLGTIKSNSFDIHWANGDVLIPGRCVMEGNFVTDDSQSHTMYVNNHNIVNGNIFGGYTYGSSISIKYVSTSYNLIINNILYHTSQISKIGTGTATVVDNNISWS